MVHITDWLPTLIRVAGGDLSDYPELQDIDGTDQVLLMYCDHAKVVSVFSLSHNPHGISMTHCFLEAKHQGRPLFTT